MNLGGCSKLILLHVSENDIYLQNAYVDFIMQVPVIGS